MRYIANFMMQNTKEMEFTTFYTPIATCDAPQRVDYNM